MSKTKKTTTDHGVKAVASVSGLSNRNSTSVSYTRSLSLAEQNAFQEMIKDYQDYFDKKRDLAIYKHDLDLKYSELNNRVRSEQTDKAFENTLKYIEDARQKKAESLLKALASFNDSGLSR